MVSAAVSSAFLQQAHRNNWQRYLESLRAGARTGWDLCILTAAGEQQADMYRKQLEWRAEAGLLPAATEFVVLPDPQGQRIGSGGATLRALGGQTPRHPYPAARRTLIIHSGGDAKRLPQCSAVGKLFARIPRTLPDGRASTVFDEFLISLSGMAGVLPPGALVASGDVLLVFDHLQLSFLRQGVTGVAAFAPAEMGTRHGVFVTEPETNRLRAYLHKPGKDELARWQAVDHGRVQIDTGLVWLDGETVRLFTGLASDQAVSNAPLNLYGDLLLPLAHSTEAHEYYQDTSDGPATGAVRAARQALWPKLRGIPLTVEQLQPAVFVHFGSSREYYEMAAVDSGLAELCGWEARTAAWPPAQDEADRLILINSTAVAARDAGSKSPLLVTDSDLRGPVTWEDAGIVAGVRTAQPLHLRAGTVIDQLPLAGRGIVTRVYGIDDDPKRGADDKRATFCNRPWGQWLAAAGVSAEDIWPHMKAGRRTLWDARVFPVSGRGGEDEGLLLALWLAAPERAPVGWREQWLAAKRVSLAESAQGVDGERLLAQLVGLEDLIAGRRFCAGVLAEEPAAALKCCLYTTPAIAPRRAGAAAELLTDEPWEVRLRGLCGLTEATGDATWEDGAFALLAEKIEGATLRQAPALLRSGDRTPPTRCSFRVEAAARIDFGGGWTDTPPYSIERGGTVLNAAVTLRGAHPIVAEAQRLEEPRLILENRDLDARAEPQTLGEVLNYANPLDLFALHKAALVLRGLIPAGEPNRPVAEVLRAEGGIRLSTATRIPMGSGLGVSSILAGAVLAALSGLTGEDSPRMDRLFDEVLCVEQMLTTGGGWQDQVGGLTGGIKLVTSGPGLPQQVTVSPVMLDEPTRAELADRLVLVYTGQQRLAKNLLRNVMRRWMNRDPEMVWIQGEIARLALDMRAALLAGDLDQFGGLLGEHWTLNKRMDPGCTNPLIDDMFAAMRPLICGGKLAGAGGGGFGFVVVQRGADAAALDDLLRARYPGTRTGVWESGVPEVGMIRVANQ